MDGGADGSSEWAPEGLPQGGELGKQGRARKRADSIAFHQPHRRAERESAPVIMAAHIKCMRMSALFVQKSEAEWHRGNTASVGNDWGVFVPIKNDDLGKEGTPL